MTKAQIEAAATNFLKGKGYSSNGNRQRSNVRPKVMKNRPRIVIGALAREAQLSSRSS